MVCKLSILICTIPERKELFNSLYEKINFQIGNNSVQIIYDDAPKGTITIGAKRNKLLNQALGEYVVFIDDDDDIAFDYVDSILSAIDKAPDCIGFKVLCNMDGKKEIAASSMKYDWTDNVDGFRYVRSIYHKTPVKREIALKCMFPDKSYSEDYEYSMRLKPHLKSEIFIDKFLYIYRYKYENPITKYGI
jgi:glycosyltransferase involved in cell wall biosynthesis